MRNWFRRIQPTVHQLVLAGTLACLMLGSHEPALLAADTAKFTVFIHGGGAPNEEVVKRLAAAVASKGYNIRGLDKEQDTIGGPGIDYFYDEDKAAAEDIAQIINKELAANDLSANVNSRKQGVKNPPGYIGVWLFPVKK